MAGHFTPSCAMNSIPPLPLHACDRCAHWNDLEDSTGECRRHAPQTISFEVDDELRFESMFPMTASDDWCGDYAVAES